MLSTQDGGRLQCEGSGRPQDLAEAGPHPTTGLRGQLRGQVQPGKYFVVIK